MQFEGGDELHINKINLKLQLILLFDNSVFF
jgi:hypothetical protein